MSNLKPQKVLHLHLEEAKKNPKISGNYMVTEKLDGWYAYIDYDTDKGWGYVHSRQGREIPSLQWLHSVFVEVPTPTENCRFIFEVTIDGLDFHTTNGILNRTKGTCQAWQAKVNLHDVVFTDIYHRDEPKNTAAARRIHLNSLDLIMVSDTIRRIPVLAISPDRDVWMTYFNEIIEKGGEGVILKRTNSLYESDKRNSNLMKIKLEETAILECVDIYYTTGDKGNSNLNVTLRNKAKKLVNVRIPKHSDVAAIEDDSSYILGKAVMIKAMCKLPDGLYREPRYWRIINELPLGAID
jgi:ATP-dependent DNA ligase